MHVNWLVIPTLLLSLLLWWVGIRVSRLANTRGSRLFLLLTGILFALPAFLFAFYYTHLIDGAGWYYRLRSIQWTEVSAGGIGFLAGTLQGWFQPDTKGSKLFFAFSPLVFAFIPFSKPILSPLDFTQLHDRTEMGVTMQSTPSTCGPASAATVLKNLGYSVSERDLAREAFTYRGGTENWYLARALNHRGFDTDFAILSSSDPDFPWPSIAGVRLPGGAGHFVAVLSESGDRVTIGDPLRGKLVVQKSNLRDLYQFTGFFMVVRARYGRN